MASPSPLLSFHRAAGAILLAYGQQSQSAEAPPAEQPRGAKPPVAPGIPTAIDLVATYGQLEVEYAAIRKHCGLLDLPSRGVLEVTGPDRLDFLNRMVTQELRPGKQDAPAYSLARTFWLSRKGRIDADMRVAVLPGRVMLELDALAAPRAAASLSSFIIMEDCAVKDLSASLHCLGLDGPTAGALLARVFQPNQGAPMIPDMPDSGGATEGTIAGSPVTVLRDDTAGVAGFEVITPVGAAIEIARQLIAVGHDASHETGVALPVLTPQGSPGAHPSGIRLSPVGWLAYNIARIEAGTPLFNIDFGMESLPAETGVLHARVSFTKGCYLGQEVVARMHARAQSKQQLVSVKFESARAAQAVGDTAFSEGENPYALLPTEGTILTAETASGPLGVGVVTSSTLSPLASMSPIAFAQVKSAHGAAGTVLTAQVEGVHVKGVVQTGLAIAAPSRT